VYRDTSSSSIACAFFTRASPPTRYNRTTQPVIPTGAASLFLRSRSEHWPRSGGISLRFIEQALRAKCPASYGQPASNFRRLCVSLLFPASAFSQSFLFNTLHTLCVALFLSWLSFSPSFCLLSTLYKLFFANRGVYRGADLVSLGSSPRERRNLHSADHFLRQRLFHVAHLRDVVEHISVAAAQVFG
jgi:hypothetical protein